jgi:hypothetical protein
MKVAVYIDENLKQINLTPESKYERDVVFALKDGRYEMEIHSGTFSTCAGGWLRYYGEVETNKETVFIVLKEKKKAENEEM